MITYEHERRKYEKVWGQVPSYRSTSPGERLLPHFLERYKPPASVIDIGCGPGRAAEKLQAAGFRVVGFDIASNCLDKGITVEFMTGCVWRAVPDGFDYFYCTDVMEHLPPEHIDAALRNIATAARAGFFQIALFAHDVADERLHLTVEPAEFWIKKIIPLWRVCEFKTIESQRLSVFVEGPC